MGTVGPAEAAIRRVARDVEQRRRLGVALDDQSHEAAGERALGDGRGTARSPPPGARTPGENRAWGATGAIDDASIDRPRFTA